MDYSYLLCIQDGETPLLCAAARGHLDIVRILIESGALLNTVDKHGLTALHHAVRRHHFSIAKFLCEAGANVNLQDKVWASLFIYLFNFFPK